MGHSQNKVIKMLSAITNGSITEDNNLMAGLALAVTCCVALEHLIVKARRYLCVQGSRIDCKAPTILEEALERPIHGIQYFLNPQEFKRNIPKYIRDNNLDAMGVVLDNDLALWNFINGDTLLTYTLKEGTPEMLELILTYPKWRKFVNYKVLELIEYGTPEMISKVLRSGCTIEINWRDLHFYRGRANLPVLKVLLEHGQISGEIFQILLLNDLGTDTDLKTYQDGMEFLSGIIQQRADEKATHPVLNPFELARALGEKGEEMIRTSIEQAANRRPRYYHADFPFVLEGEEFEDLMWLLKFFKFTPSAILLQLQAHLEPDRVLPLIPAGAGAGAAFVGF
jgi:hypothetical protein